MEVYSLERLKQVKIVCILSPYGYKRRITETVREPQAKYSQVGRTLADLNLALRHKRDRKLQTQVQLWTAPHIFRALPCEFTLH